MGNEIGGASVAADRDLPARVVALEAQVASLRQELEHLFEQLHTTGNKLNRVVLWMEVQRAKAARDDASG